MPTTDAADVSALAKLAGETHRRFTFIKEFIKSPGEVAAVSPSSKRLASKMIEGLDFSTARAVVEYGPGLGTFTKAITEQIRATQRGMSFSNRVRREPCHVIAIERNERMAELLARRYPELSLHHDDAANVQQICAAEGFEQVDYVVSGLGWPSFDDDLRTRILEATAAVLKPGGEFRTFGYHCGLLLRGAWHFRRTVRRLFSEVTISEVVWRNMPPAFVYRCVK